MRMQPDRDQNPPASTAAAQPTAAPSPPAPIPHPTPQVADRLEGAVNTALDKNLRTKDIWTEGTTLVKCSELGDKLIEFL
jgi:hypothetical protein